MLPGMIISFLLSVHGPGDSVAKPLPATTQRASEPSPLRVRELQITIAMRKKHRARARVSAAGQNASNAAAFGSAIGGGSESTAYPPFVPASICADCGSSFSPPASNDPASSPGGGSVQPGSTITINGITFEIASVSC